MNLVYGIVLQLLLLHACTFCNCALVAPPPLPGRGRGTGAPVLVGFYNRTCPRAEDIIRAQVQKRFLLDKSIAPALLRMLFHDSFVRGADASILLDSKPDHEAEKEALPNLTIRGFDLIDEAKGAVEAVCPGVVSCADVLVLAVRDSVALAGGPKYEVPTGRLDGKVSLKEEALNLPSPAFPVEQSLESFRQKGLDLEDMVALLGAHTVGVALCGFFNDRLFNFHGTGMADPTMNPQLVTRLSGVCPNPFFTESNADPPIDLDQSTPALFDAAYYTQILAGNGILQIDQEITDDPATIGLVHSFTSATNFFPAFVKSIIKMGNIDVITGSSPEGEIRRKCNVSNSPAAAGVPAPATKPGSATKPGPATKPSLTPTKRGSTPVPVTKPGPATKPGSSPAPVTKPGPSPAPVTKPGFTPVTKRRAPAPVTRSPPAGHATKPAPPGQARKPPAATKPMPPAPKPSKPPARPSPAGHVSKTPVRHVTPATKPAPRRKSPIPTPPFGHVIKPPVTPAKPGHVRTPPVGHVSRPSPGPSRASLPQL